MKMKDSLNERILRAKAKTAQREYQRRIDLRATRQAEKKVMQRQCYIVGEMVIKHFPVLKNYQPGTKEENAITFMPVEAFLTVLSQEQKLVQALKIRAARLTEADTGKP